MFWNILSLTNLCFKNKLRQKIMTIKQKRLTVLEETVKHFNSNNRSTIGAVCVYSGVGCAIGRLIKNKQLCKELDSYCVSAVDSKNVYPKLPKNLQKLGIDFLKDLQTLHDREVNWNDKGISDVGREITNDIKKQYC